MDVKETQPGGKTKTVGYTVKDIAPFKHIDIVMNPALRMNHPTLGRESLTLIALGKP